MLISNEGEVKNVGEVKCAKATCKGCKNKKVKEENGVYLLKKKAGEIVCQFCEKC